MPEVFSSLHFRFHPFERSQRIAVFAHQDDALDDLIAVVPSDDPEPWRVADVYVSDITHASRYRDTAVERGVAADENDVTYVIQGRDKADPANVECLLANLDDSCRRH